MLASIKRAFSGTPYPVLTFAVWGAAALCASIASLLAVRGIEGVLGCGLAISMIAIAAIDARCFLIPDKLVLVGLALGFVVTAITQPEHIATNLAGAALRGFVVAMFFFGFRALYRRVRGREGLGLGDVKLAGVAGVWLGWIAVSLAVDIAALSALIAVLIGLIRGREITWKTRLPFGLFFAPAIWLAWLGERVFLLQSN
jgi:leader peptidase (prepilin peptidase) / N-methyltransferase